VSEKRNYRTNLVRVIRSVLYLRFFGDLDSLAEVSLRFLLAQGLPALPLSHNDRTSEDTARSDLE
jgi:hypothetical protein